jgi:hypothetical protein
MRSEWRILIGKPEGMILLGDICVTGKVISKLIIG